MLLPEPLDTSYKEERCTGRQKGAHLMGMLRVDIREVRVAVRRIVSVLVRMRHGGVVMRIQVVLGQVQPNSNDSIIGLRRWEWVKSEKS